MDKRLSNNIKFKCISFKLETSIIFENLRVV